MTSRVFRFMVLSFFISNIMTVLGSVIDGFVVGNTMDENTIAAVGFVSPVVILFSIIGATACVGFKNVATRYLSKGDTEGAGRAFGEALVIALSLSVIVMILTLMFTPTVVAGLGIHKTSGEYLPCVRYLRGTALGLPAITAMAVFSILLWIFARLVAWLYLGNVGDVVLGATAAALRAYTVGIMFQMIIRVFANYIQNFKHVVIPIILFFISNVVAVLYGEGFGIGVVGETSLNYTAGIFGGISVANILMVLIFLPIFIR